MRCGFGLGTGLIALEAAPGLTVAVPILFVVGMSLMVMWASINTRVQTLVSDDMLGRVMSLYAVAFFGGAPVGALLLGTLASLLGPIHAFALSGVGCLLCTLLFRRAFPGLEGVAPLRGTSSRASRRVRVRWTCRERLAKMSGPMSSDESPPMPGSDGSHAPARVAERLPPGRHQRDHRGPRVLVGLPPLLELRAGGGLGCHLRRLRHRDRDPSLGQLATLWRALQLEDDLPVEYRKTLRWFLG